MSSNTSGLVRPIRIPTSSEVTLVELTGQTAESRKFLRLLIAHREEINRYWEMRDSTHTTVEDVMASFAQQSPHHFSFGMWLAGDELVGKLHIGRPLYLHKSGIWRIGGFTDLTYRKRGFGSSARRALALWAYSALGAERVGLQTHISNQGSQASAKKAGFVRTRLSTNNGDTWVNFHYPLP